VKPANEPQRIRLFTVPEAAETGNGETNFTNFREYKNAVRGAAVG
jgi:hypothetical protein